MLNGGYERWFLNDGTDVRARVYRKFCKKCRVSFSLLSEDALAHWQYPRRFVTGWLKAALQGTPCRDRAFRLSQGVPLPEPEPNASWPEQQEDGKVWPCHQLLARWSREFAVRSARLIPTLTLLCVQLGIEMKTAAESVWALRNAPSRLSSMVTALGLTFALTQGRQGSDEIDLDTCLAELVVVLVRRRLPSSHGVLRASGGRLLYDSLVT